MRLVEGKLTLLVQVQHSVRHIVTVDDTNLKVNAMLLDELLDGFSQAVDIRGTGVDGELGALLGQPGDGRVDFLEEVWLVALGDFG